jgi:hypothetical protein
MGEGERSAFAWSLSASISSMSEFPQRQSPRAGLHAGRPSIDHFGAYRLAQQSLHSHEFVK